MASTASNTPPADGTAAPKDAEWSSNATVLMVLAGVQRLIGTSGKGLAALVPMAARTLLPLLAIYATGSSDEALEHGDEDSEGSAATKDRQAALARRAGTKALLELIELASRTHPVIAGATTFSAYQDGQPQAPRIEHVMALALAAAALFERASLSDQQSGGDAEPASQALNRVTYVAVAPGEYQTVSGPMTPAEIRRYAMRERSYSQPQLAMLAKRDNSFTVLPASAGSGAGTAMYQRPTAEQYGRMMISSGGAGGCGCGGACGGACGCGSGVPACGCKSCGGRHILFPPARLDEDGKCMSMFSISCETKTRVRECFKQSLCDLLRCVGEEVCEDGRFSSTKPDLGKCLEGFVCSLLTCLPEAICPPPAKVCITQPVSDCDCNYAVGS